MKKSDIVLGLIEIAVVTVMIYFGMVWAETGSAREGRWTIVLFVIALLGAGVMRSKDGND